ncbi:MAG: hypothetical protein LBC44_03990 [Mycoplasmataceae bacterium]|nr:hypothetical protein [Mycoplasmataceae bacterium]
MYKYLKIFSVLFCFFPLLFANSCSFFYFNNMFKIINIKSFPLENNQVEYHNEINIELTKKIEWSTLTTLDLNYLKEQGEESLDISLSNNYNKNVKNQSRTNLYFLITGADENSPSIPSITEEKYPYKVEFKNFNFPTNPNDQNFLADNIQVGDTLLFDMPDESKESVFNILDEKNKIEGEITSIQKDSSGTITSIGFTSTSYGFDAQKFNSEGCKFSKVVQEGSNIKLPLGFNVSNILFENYDAYSTFPLEKYINYSYEEKLESYLVENAYLFTRYSVDNATLEWTPKDNIVLGNKSLKQQDLLSIGEHPVKAKLDLLVTREKYDIWSKLTYEIGLKYFYYFTLTNPTT